MISVIPRTGLPGTLEGVKTIVLARERILREHAELRTRLDEIDALLEECERDAEAVVRLRELGLSLYRRLSEHIDLEDRMLVPALRALRTDGPQRAADLQRTHAEQRELLTFLVGRLEDPSRPAVLTVRELRNFADYVREDMNHEEFALLNRLTLPARDAAATQ
jgi:ribosomal protein S28E/S33